METATDALVHEALLYRDLDQFVDGTAAFVSAGVAAGNAALVAVPSERIEPLRARLGDGATYVDMRELGRNPGRIIPAIEDFLLSNPGRRASFVGEPVWVGRSERELAEAARHERLLNQVFAGRDVSILCPYDAAGLDATALAEAERSHPVVCADHGRSPSRLYAPLDIHASTEFALPPAPAEAPECDLSAGLGAVRAFVRAGAEVLGIEGSRLEDLLLAVNEAAANALVHGGGWGTVRSWNDRTHMTCEVSGGGRIDDPLAGRRFPPPLGQGGRGLWLMNQVCDLVELRSDAGGTTVRVHMRLAA